MASFRKFIYGQLVTRTLLSKWFVKDLLCVCNHPKQFHWKGVISIGECHFSECSCKEFALPTNLEFLDIVEDLDARNPENS